MEDFGRAVAEFVRDHQAWAAPIVFLLAFGESLAFICTTSAAALLAKFRAENGGSVWPWPTTKGSSPKLT